jgi:hypothetical protein
MTMAMLAFTPFVDPLWGGWNYWYLFLLPLALIVTLVYKTIRLDDLGQLGVHTIRAFLRLIGAFIGCAILLWVIVLILERK